MPDIREGPMDDHKPDTSTTLSPQDQSQDPKGQDPKGQDPKGQDQDQSQTHCSIHDRCIWELCLEGAKRDRETAIDRMEKAESEASQLRFENDQLRQALQAIRAEMGRVAWVTKLPVSG